MISSPLHQRGNDTTSKTVQHWQQPHLSSSVNATTTVKTSTRIPRFVNNIKERFLSVPRTFRSTSKAANVQIHESTVCLPDQRFDNVPILPTGIFPNARDFTVNDSNFISVNGPLYVVGGRLTYPEKRPPLQPDEIELESEIYIGKYSRLHRGKTNGKVVVVKVFEGCYGRQVLEETVKLIRPMMHPNILRVYGEPNYEYQFVLFHGDCQRTVATELALALMDGIQTTWNLGANTIIGCLRAFLYLQMREPRLLRIGLDHFVPIISKDGKVMISFDVDVLLDTNSRLDTNADLTMPISNLPHICSAVIQKTFYTATQRFYLTERLYQDEEDQGSSNADYEVGKDMDASEGYPPQVVDTSETSHAMSQGHRRELIWKSLSTFSWSLEEVARSYENSLLQAYDEKGLTRRHGRPPTQISHRCRGYKRTELILTPHIDQSGIISHTSPVANEICLVCGERVNMEELFDCLCGSLNHDPHPSRPTIRCTICHRWQHQDCLRIRTHMQMKKYKCLRCISDAHVQRRPRPPQSPGTTGLPLRKAVPISESWSAPTSGLLSPLPT